MAEPGWSDAAWHVVLERRNVKIDGGGVIDGGGERWWEVWAAKQAGDRDAAAFLSRDR